MNITQLLPIGSVVLLNGGEKRLMIIGLKQTKLEENKEYDYMAIFYPEGFIGDTYHYLFDHEDIREVIFRGFEDEERTAFLQKLNDFYENQVTI